MCEHLPVKVIVRPAWASGGIASPSPRSILQGCSRCKHCCVCRGVIEAVCGTAKFANSVKIMKPQAEPEAHAGEADRCSGDKHVAIVLLVRMVFPHASGRNSGLINLRTADILDPL